MLFKKKFPYIPQFDSQDCGFTCLKMISSYYGVNPKCLQTYFEEADLIKQGISIADLDKTAQEVGYETMVVKMSFDEMIEHAPLPAVFFWNQNHFIVVYKINKNKIYVSDPGFGKVIYTKEEFIEGWAQNKKYGLLLLLNPTSKLFKINHLNKQADKSNIRHVAQYLKKHKREFAFIILTLLVSSIIELILPFCTQQIIDSGVTLENVNLIYLILVAQVLLYLSQIGLEFYRSWLFIYIGSRISLAIISDFLVKLMKLPLKFFNSKNTGDLIERIHDHKRIEEFLSKDLLQTFFSIFTIVIYGAVLLYFNLSVFLVLFLGTCFELFWIFRFLDKIKILDHKSFSLQAKDQNKIYELITHMQEIKLNNLEEYKREEWQKIQIATYLNNINKLKVNQQYESYRFIGFFENILILFISSMAVMNGTLSIGSMLAIIFIIGGINTPLGQLINFILDYQLVKLSFERMGDIHNRSDEENVNQISSLSEIKDITFENTFFSYNSKTDVLKNINCVIPKGKTTAIVGVSGSGKTTLLKLLLKFYNPASGNIYIGDNPIRVVDNKFWRNKCGAILQDSSIFSETIAYNISLNKNYDPETLQKAMNLANVSGFVSKLPLKENTIIGDEGIGVSEGQKQRIFIARAIYKNPDYLLFDEATNSLDTENEAAIVNNINTFFKGKTMIIVAHRLSTVVNADQIIVLDNGTIIETGTHQDLIKLKGKYFNLIQNQLELGL